MNHSAEDCHVISIALVLSSLSIEAIYINSWHSTKTLLSLCRIAGAWLVPMAGRPKECPVVHSEHVRMPLLQE